MLKLKTEVSSVHISNSISWDLPQRLNCTLMMVLESRLRSNMNRFTLFSILLTFSACAQTPSVEKITQVIRPGEVRWLEFPIKGDQPRLICRGQEMKFGKVGSKGQAIVMESYFSELQPFKCIVEADGKPTHEIDFKVEAKEYKAEQLRVDP